MSVIKKTFVKLLTNLFKKLLQITFVCQITFSPFTKCEFLTHYRTIHFFLIGKCYKQQ